MKKLKKILCITLVLLMCFGAVSPAVSAIRDTDAPEILYRDVISETLGERFKDYNYKFLYAYNADGTAPQGEEMPDYVVGQLAINKSDDEVVELYLGDYYFYQSYYIEHFKLKYLIYSSAENKCYSFEEAWDAQLPNIENVFAMFGTKIKNDNTYIKEVYGVLGWDASSDEYIYDFITSYNADGSTVDEGATPDYAVAFATVNCFSTAEIKETIGNYSFYSPNIYSPYRLGYLIYSFEDNKCYSLREAWDLRLPNVEIALAKVGTKVGFYAEEFEKFFAPYREEEITDPQYPWYGYSELYYYNSLTGGSIEMPESTPDYVLVDATAYYCPPAYKHEVIGGYVVSSSWGIPEGITYYVYTPKDNRIYTLKAAYDAKLDGIMNVFTDYGLGFLLGDMDDDQKITIKDATYIQKSLANFEGFDVDKKDPSIPDWVVIDMADFDLNGKINIKDATAIQKHLAKITE